MLDVEVIQNRAAAVSALGTIRGQILAELSSPASAAALANRLGLARQKVTYHLKMLEEHGLVRVAETRKWGGLTERLFVASASSYVVAPDAIQSNDVGASSRTEDDALSSSYLISLASRIVREVGELVRRAAKSEQRLATLSIDAEIRFRSAEERAAFSNDLANAVATLVARYHDESAPGGRPHRLVVVAHPTPHTPESKE